MFMTSALLSSAITVAPGGGKLMGTLMATALVLAFTSGLLAVFLRRQFRKNPDSFIFKSKMASGICVNIAAITTLILIFGVVG